MRILVPVLLLFGSSGPLVAAGQAPHRGEPAIRDLPLPVWNQWQANHGYCGEAALVTAGMHFGQYCSQYEVRRLASGGTPQNRAGSQLLLGRNELQAAERMKLRAQRWRGGSTARFTTWIGQNIAEGHPVIIGVYLNHAMFYGDADRAAGDAEYDHIVTVHGTREAHGAALLRFRDHGLYDTPGGGFFNGEAGPAEFIKTRAEANQPGGPPYALPGDTRNYGLAILGPADAEGVTLPVRLGTPSRAEDPPMTDGSEKPPPPRPLDLTARVLIPDTSQAVHLYLYDRFSAVPDRNFNALAGRAVRRWVFPPNSGTIQKVRIRIPSNQVAVFRAVPAAAP